MINLNGSILNKTESIISSNNRAFKYGDALFETIKVENLHVVFIEDHYFRLMASMRMLRMEIPMTLTLEFLESEIHSLVEENNLLDARVRFSVFRKDGGLYNPLTNEIDYLIEASELDYQEKENYSIDIFKDYYVYSGLLSTIKTTNKITNVLASIYASENDIDNCILLNERKQVVEAINGNIFVVKGNNIKTPPTSDGCVKGIIRKKIIEIISKNDEYSIIEESISPFDLQKADEIFITNAIIGIQPVTNYKKSVFGKTISTVLIELLSNLD
jgi:branched-chain amino acid aminotransferase